MQKPADQPPPDVMMLCACCRLQLPTQGLKRLAKSGRWSVDKQVRDCSPLWVINCNFQLHLCPYLTPVLVSGTCPDESPSALCPWGPTLRTTHGTLNLPPQALENWDHNPLAANILKYRCVSKACTLAASLYAVQKRTKHQRSMYNFALQGGRETEQVGGQHNGRPA
jgi:hypothetical protein